MKYVDEFRDEVLIAKEAAHIRAAVNRKWRFMEVCGTHTMSIFRFALRQILPGDIELVSGPGCPVCVTPNGYLDKAIAIAGMKNVIIATFGDMLRVPGSHSTLEIQKADGRDIRTVYSTTDALEIAEKYPTKEVVFLGVGFETTVPTVAKSIIIAKKAGLKNYSVLSAHKTMPEALGSLAGSGLNVDGFILPGHVSAITGTSPYRFLAKIYKKRCVVSGFEPLDILQSISILIKQSPAKVEIQYKRIAAPGGNPKARVCIYKVFEKCDSVWRGIGRVADSGLKIKKAYADLDAEVKFHPRVRPPKEDKRCRCGDVLRGLIAPTECMLFGKACTSQHPIGACMVSSEGTCAAYYKYRGNING
ncbi:MAG: hydrogenase formation protein HypD [Candidatus Omnitrophica bacterium]|nr:hydrogenase formation protein HypD [Candidatus Omnitrophota bacterium]